MRRRVRAFTVLKKQTEGERLNGVSHQGCHAPPCFPTLVIAMLIDEPHRAILRLLGEYGPIPAAKNVVTFSVVAFPRIILA